MALKHAYLITAYNEPQVLIELCRRLDNPNNDIYIHIDKKVDINVFLPAAHVCRYSKVEFTKKRYAVFWGGDNQIRSELLLYQTAKSSGSYDYYHMISGADLPIKDNEYINDYFEKNNGKEFMTFFDRKPEEIIDRVRYRYFFIDLKQNRLLQHINSLSLTFQRKFHIIRHIPEDIILKKGEGWCTLTSKAVDYILANKHLIKKYFSNSFIGIEVYKQTLLWNSPYRKNISEAGNLTLILWPDRNNPHPHVFNASDTELLRNNSALYARKFSKDFMFEP